MNRPTIYHSHLGCLITNYPIGLCSRLEAENSIWDPIYYRAIPTFGFNLPYKGYNAYLTYQISESEMSIHLPNSTQEKMPINSFRKLDSPFVLNKLESFKPAQIDILDKVESSRKSDRAWFINLQTAFGKTVLSVELCSRFNVKTWITCFSSSILSQWKETYIKYSNMKPERILIIKSSKHIVDLLTGKKNVDDYDIFLSTTSLLSSFANKVQDYSILYEMFNIFGIGLLIFDEAHRHMSNLIKISAVTNVKYQLYLSADFAQGDRDKEVIFRKIFRTTKLLTTTLEMERSLKYTKLMVVKYNSNPSVSDNLQVFGKYGYTEIEFIRYEFSKGVMMEALLKVLSSIYKSENTTSHRSLILISTVHEVDLAYIIIKDFLSNNNIDMPIGRFHQDINDDDKDWVKNNARIIISTYKSFSTGIDTADIKYVFSTNQCNKVTDNQSAGRARPLSDGSDAIYIMLVDSGFEYCTKKLKKRLGYLLHTKSSHATPYVYEYNK